MKIVICAGTLLMAAITIAGFQDFKDVERHMPEWRKSANYVNISCGWPWTYVEDDDKFNEDVVPKLNRLWDELDREGAILFFAPNIEEIRTEAAVNAIAFMLLLLIIAFVVKIDVGKHYWDVGNV